MPFIHAIRANSTTEYIGLFLLIFGFFFLLSGLEVLQVEKVTVKPGRSTWIFGVILIAFGITFLLPDIIDSFQQPSVTPPLVSNSETAFPSGNTSNSDKLGGVLDSSDSNRDHNRSMGAFPKSRSNNTCRLERKNMLSQHVPTTGFVVCS